MNKRLMKKLCKRVLAAILTMALSVPSTGMPLFAANKQQAVKPAHSLPLPIREMQKREMETRCFTFPAMTFPMHYLMMGNRVEETLQSWLL